MRAANGGPDQPQASSQCRARPEGQVLSQPTAFPVRELSPGRFGASPAPSPRCAQERSPPPIFRLGRGRDACFMSRRPKVRILHRPPLVLGIARRTCQRGTLSHNSGPSARGFKSRSPDQPSRIRDCKYWNSQIYTLGSPGRVRNLHRKTPLERRERQYRQQGTNLQGVDGGS